MYIYIYIYIYMSEAKRLNFLYHFLIIVLSMRNWIPLLNQYDHNDNTI